jgi:LuxR family transcriptional regulator, maltose regulon positive regulatory protein
LAAVAAVCRLTVVVIEPLTIEPVRDERKRPHTVARTSLVNRLCAAVDVPVVAIVAPAGFGKTTLLRQWAARDQRATSWHTVDDVHAELAAGAATPGRLLLVDDADALRSPAAVTALQQLLHETAAGTTVAFAARAEPPRLLPRLRASGRLLDIGPSDLTLGERDAQALLRRAGVLLPERDAARLVERTEGWPAALALAALALRGGVAPATFGGDDRYLVEYLEAEQLAALTPAERRFAEQTCILDELTLDACTALVDHLEGKRTLASLERKGLVVPLDHRRERYRYRRLVRDALLTRLEPQRSRSLHRAVASWSAARGANEDALRHAIAAEDFRLAGKLGAQAVPAALRDGRIGAAEELLDALDDERLPQPDAEVCLAGWWLCALRGRATDSRRWADAALRRLTPGDPRAVVLQALRARDGANTMLVDADAACVELPAGSPWHAAATIARGVASGLVSDDAGDADLVDVLDSDASDLRLLASALLARRADEHGDDPVTRVLVAALPREATVLHVLVHALSSRAALRAGDRDAAVQDVDRADELAGLLTPAAPWLSAIAGLELVRTHAVLGDADRARLALRRVADVLRARPGFTSLVHEMNELDARVQLLAEPEGRWATSLTRAELRLLPLLATHLSFREIGQRLFVSRNTVKTQAISIYRKFGVSSRSEAIARAADFGLLDN